jgi:hypothetical protein
MKQVKVLVGFHVAKTNTTYTKGQEVEVSDELANRHGKDGTGFIEVSKPKKEA